MSGAESEREAAERAPVVRVTPQFDGAGGVLLLLEIPPDSILREGVDVTVKVWAGPVESRRTLPALGAPTAVRTAAVPFAEYAAGEGYDASHAPPFYAVTTKVLVGFDEVARAHELFEVVPHDGVRTLSR